MGSQHILFVFTVQKELDYLQGAVMEPKRPFAAIVGGSKVCHVYAL
jgi:3-phosphoglycerate kinase